MEASDSTIDPQLVISYKFPEATFTYTERDVALYALGVGACAGNPLDEEELKYVYHKNGQSFIRVLPTFVVLFSSRWTIMKSIPGLCFDPTLLLHGQQYLEIYKPIPTNCCIQNRAVIAGLHDKGKATVVEIETTSYDKESGEALCMNRNTIYLRGAGGFSKLSPLYSYSKYTGSPVSPVIIPKSKPFVVHEDCTQQSQALLYRLSGDYNPLHSDPTVAQIAGFSRPILHGLCSLGFATRAIIKCCCNGEPNAVKSILGRFLLHVYPGETLVTEMWLQGLRVIYQVKAKERSRTVLSGYVILNIVPSSL